MNDYKEGLAQFFYPDGQIAKEIVFAKDKFEGISKNYHRDGTLMLEVFFRNDKIVEGFSYKTGQKDPLSEEELKALKALKHILFYDNRSVDEQLLDNISIE